MEEELGWQDGGGAGQVTTGWGSIYKGGKPACSWAGELGTRSRGTGDPVGFGECPHHN